MAVRNVQYPLEISDLHAAGEAGTFVSLAQKIY
jgi:hypothetical protein